MKLLPPGEHIHEHEVGELRQLSVFHARFFDGVPNCTDEIADRRLDRLPVHIFNLFHGGLFNKLQVLVTQNKVTKQRPERGRFS